MKLSQFQLNPNSTKNNNMYIKKRYLNYEGDDWINKKFDNYKLYNMTPNYKKSKSTSNKAIHIQNPLIKSRIIETKKIEGNEYSFIHEKIIDKDNLKLYNSFDRMSHSYDYENIYGNHRYNDRAFRCLCCGFGFCSAVQSGNNDIYRNRKRTCNT